MADNILTLKTERADDGSRKQAHPWWAWFGGFGTAIGVIGLGMILLENPPVTWDKMGGWFDVTEYPDSPGIRLIGEVTKTRHYGIFHTFAHKFPFPSYTYVTGVTVIRDDGHYFLAESDEVGFLRSLIDKNKFPQIGIGPLERLPLKATSQRAPLTRRRNT